MQRDSDKRRESLALVASLALGAPSEQPAQNRCGHKPDNGWTDKQPALQQCARVLLLSLRWYNHKLWFARHAQESSCEELLAALEAPGREASPEAYVDDYERWCGQSERISCEALGRGVSGSMLSPYTTAPMQGTAGVSLHCRVW